MDVQNLPTSKVTHTEPIASAGGRQGNFRPFQHIYVDTVEITVKDWPGPSKSGAQTMSSPDILQRFPIQNEQGESPRYLLVIVDEYTRYCWVEMLYSKEANEVAIAFSRWKITQIPISRELRLRSSSDYANENIPAKEILAIHSDKANRITATST